MAGISIKADEEGVQMLNTMASVVEESAKNMISICDSLLSDVQGISALGPHKDQIDRAIEQIEELIKGATSPAMEVAEKFKEKARQYQEFIDDDF